MVTTNMAWAELGRGRINPPWPRPKTMTMTLDNDHVVIADHYDFHLMEIATKSNTWHVLVLRSGQGSTPPPKQFKIFQLACSDCL